MDTQTAGYQNKLLGAVAQTDYTGGLDCLRRRLDLWKLY